MTVLERSRPASAVLVVVLVMAGACVAQAFGRFTYGVLLPAVRDDMLGSNRAAGLIGTVNVTAYLVGTVLVATLSKRITLVWLIRIGLCLSTVGLLLASVAGNGLALAGALVLTGLGGAAIWIPSPRVAASVLPPARRGLAAGLIGMGIGIGIVFAGQLSDALRHDHGDAARRDVYRVEGSVGAVVLVAAFAFLRHREAEPTVVPVAAPTGAGPGPDVEPPLRRRGDVAGFGSLRQVNGWIPLTLAYAAFGFMYLLVFAFLVARLEDDSGFSADQASAMFSLVGLAAVFGGVMLGPLSDRLGRRTSMVGAFSAFGVSTLAVLAGRQPLVLLGAIGIGLAFSGLPAVIAAYVVDATDAVTYGPAYSAATLAFGVSQMAAPQVGGLLADWLGSFTAVFLLSVAVAATGAIVSARLPDPRRRAPRSVEPVG
ncbi:MAG: MFS transporter [Ilumatobacteraceae bacterium]